jgi:hypothetical protein
MTDLSQLPQYCFRLLISEHIKTTYINCGSKRACRRPTTFKRQTGMIKMHLRDQIFDKPPQSANPSENLLLNLQHFTR